MVCQSPLKINPGSAFNFDPPDSREFLQRWGQHCGSLNNMNKHLSIMRVLLLVVCCILILAILTRKFTNITSDNGVINTDIITLRNSIPGYVTFSPSIRPGTPIKEGSIIYTVENSRYGNIESVAQYYSLKNQLNSLTADIASLEIELIQHKKDYRRFVFLVATNSASTEQLEHIQTDLDRVNSLVKAKKQHVQETHKDLTDVVVQLKLFKTEEGRSLFQGVIWSVIARSGEYMASASSLLEIIDKNNVWVDAYFSEKHADNLKPHHPVTIKVIASGEEWEGKIEFIRAGVGRIAFNSPVEIPPESFKERMVVARVSIDTPNTFSAQEFYGIGRSVRVRIKK